MNNDELLEENLVKFAVKHYYSPLGTIDPDEFYADLKRFKYVKRLLNRNIETGDLQTRLILNHLVVIFNVFGPYASLRILAIKFNDDHWRSVKPFLEFLKYVRIGQFADIESDPIIEKKLKEL